MKDNKTKKNLEKLNKRTQNNGTTMSKEDKAFYKSMTNFIIATLNGEEPTELD